MTFKDTVAKDLDVFFCEDEFAERHEINGEILTCLLHGLTTGDILTKQGKNNVEYDGLAGETLVLHLKTSDIPQRVVSSNIMTVDGEVYRIAGTVEDMGITTLTLEADRI